jgi:hypothetical protein
MNKGVSFAAACGAFSLLLTTVALAVSVLLPPGASLPVPATTAATEPVLDGVVIHDALLPFTIRGVTGAPLCMGQLQDRVVRSNRTGLLDFYYAIRSTNGPGSIARIVAGSYGKLELRVAYRTDGLGTVPPRVAARSGPGPLVAFQFTDPPLSCARHQESRFMLLEAPVKAYIAGGATQIVATTGASTVVHTVEP